MAAGTNVKVGITVTIFAIILAGVLLWLSQFDPGKKSYEIQGNFTNVGGLVPGSKVYLMGVQIGQVTATIPELKYVKVMMSIDDKIKIPKQTRLVIAAKGLVGDKSVEFFIKEDADGKDFYSPGTIIAGNSPASFDDIIIEGKKAMQKANALIGDPTLNKNIRLISGNLEVFTKKLNDSLKQLDTITDNVKSISGSANGLILKTNTVMADVDSFVRDVKTMTNTNSGNIRSIIVSADNLARSLEQTSQTLNSFLNSSDNRKDFRSTAENIRNTAANIEKISKQASGISEDIRALTGDKDIRNNLKDIVNNTRVISNTFANTLKNPGQDNDKNKDKKDRLNLDFRSEILGKGTYQFGGTNPFSFTVIGNFNILAHTGFSQFPYIQLGIDEIGAANQLNLQAGFYPFDNARLRVGIVKGKLGFGGNYFINSEDTEFIADFYDIGSPHVRLGLLQRVYNDFGVSLYWDDQLITNLNEVNLGIRWQPSIF